MFDRAVPAADSGIVLGIDPGLSRCGYGAAALDGGRARAVVCGVLRTPPSDPLPERLAALEHDLEELVREVRPRAMAVERVLFQVNTRTAMSVGQASGLALAVAARAGIPVTHYSPNEVKLAVAGHGGADKAEVATMAARMLRLVEIPGPADAADALALALCHLGRERLQAATRVAGDVQVPDASEGRLAGAIAAALAREGVR
jgi:crossover junction endodeoxyribonuclease RuvC